MTNGKLTDSNLLKFSPVPGSKLQSSPPLPALCSVSLFLRSLFSPLHHGSHLILGGMYLEQNTVGKESLPLSVPNSFLSLPILTKILWSQHHRALWKKIKTFCLLSSAGSWRLLGAFVVMHRILAFFLLSLYIGLRDYTVSLCEYGQLAFTNMYLSTFSCLKKEKKNFKKNEVIEGQHRVGLRCLGG